MRYGLAIANMGTIRNPRIQQRYFDEYKENEHGISVDIKLLAGQWVTVSKAAVIRWPIKEKEE